MGITEEIFWNIINDIHNKANGDMAIKCDLMKAYMLSLSKTNKDDFRDMFNSVIGALYITDHENTMSLLWRTVGGSDDGYSDFCASLVSRGKNEYSLALKDPVLFAKNNKLPWQILFYEGFQYAVDLD
ncbi:MAG: hypothetical protein ACD_33C00046G0010 [uncultured bacterium]|nr:MAG: hypothetical protein ACD_33C00046G0010 [uncultured bacterium]